MRSTSSLPFRSASTFVVAFAFALGACGGAPTPPASSLRHAALVDRLVVRTFTTEGEALPAEVERSARAEATESIARAVARLEVPQVEQLRLDINLAEVRRQSGSVRARCLVTVSTVGPPERTRSILQGAVTVHGPADTALTEATTRSVRSALRRLPEALAAL